MGLGLLFKVQCNVCSSYLSYEKDFNANESEATLKSRRLNCNCCCLSDRPRERERERERVIGGSGNRPSMVGSSHTIRPQFTPQKSFRFMLHRLFSISLSLSLFVPTFVCFVLILHFVLYFVCVI